MTKTVYFIRHGQSRGNASLTEQQNAHTRLTSRGKRQAREVGARLASVPIDSIIASSYARAQETATEISREVGLPYDTSELFVERRRPRVQLEKKKVHPSWLWAQLHLSIFSRRTDYRHSDEETAEELLARAHDALAYLAARSEPTILVVTHGAFMRALYAAIILGEGVSGRAYLTLTRRMSLRNTALMTATYDGTAWQMQAWDPNVYGL